MILRINKAHRIAIIEACAEHGLTPEFFTDERANGLCICTIDTDNPSKAFYLGMQVKEIVLEEHGLADREHNLFDLFKINVQR